MATAQHKPCRPYPSPNFGDRRDGALPDIVVLHYTAMDTDQAALDRMCAPEAKVSAHYLIAATGECWALVDEGKRAWHAGAGQWGDVSDVNSRSIGIELANTGAHPFPEPQMIALEALLSGIMARWSIPAQRVIAHSDMAPTRKSDPGPRFDWYRLARQGLSIWPAKFTVEVPDSQRFRTCTTTLGYAEDIPDDDLLAAVRLRFRPWKTGALDARDVEIVQDLAHRFPVDRDVQST